MFYLRNLSFPLSLKVFERFALFILCYSVVCPFLLPLSLSGPVPLKWVEACVVGPLTRLLCTQTELVFCNCVISVITRRRASLCCVNLLDCLGANKFANLCLFDA